MGASHPFYDYSSMADPGLDLSDKDPLLFGGDFLDCGGIEIEMGCNHLRR
jgi:hypothetical protein